MTDLTDFAAHARDRAAWIPGPPRAACRETTVFGTPKAADHANCGGHRCGCDCHRPSDRERAMWTRLADEIDDYLDDEQIALYNQGALFDGGAA